MSSIPFPTALKADPMRPAVFRVQRRVKETSDTFTLVLEPRDKTVAISFKPGQFNMLYVLGIGEIPISISGDPAEPDRLVHTTRAVGAVTRALNAMKDGEEIGVRGPFGAGWPVEEADGADIVFLAGGIGLAPLRPAMYAALSRRDRFGKVVLLYGARTPQDILFRRELERWRSKFDLEVHVTVDRAVGAWRGNVGVVPALVQKAPFDPRNTVAMICGPEIMMRYSIQELQRRGVNTDRIFVSMERNMKCAVGLCGHCQYGPAFICKDGPVFRYDRIEDLFWKREV